MSPVERRQALLDEARQLEPSDLTAAYIVLLEAQLAKTRGAK